MKLLFWMMMKKTIILTVEKKKLNINGRDSEKFELLKNKQIEIAEKKLMEIMGQKDYS